MKAIALLRVSSEAQARPEREGLPAQRQVCERVALSYGLTIVDWVTLQNVSGAAVLANPEFAALLRRLEAPEVTAVITSEFDRLFRRGSFADYAILDAFSQNGAALYTSEGRFDPAEDSGGLLSVLKGEMAGMERRRIAERTRRGREMKRRRGLRAEGLVGMPRGVAFDPASGEWSYVFPEAEQVREVFRLFLGGLANFAEIRRRAGIGTETDTTVVQRILRQPLYTGIYRADRRWVNGRPVPREPHEIHEHEVIDPPLIPRRDFEQAQRILAEMKARRAPVSDPEVRPGAYGGFLTCGACGAAVHVVRDSKHYHAYACGNLRYKQCDQGQVSIRWADPQIDGALELMLGDESTLRRLIERSVEDGERRAAAAPSETTRRITELANKRERVKDAYEAGAYSVRDLQKRIANIDGELSVLRDLLNRDHAEITVNDEAVAALVENFASWGDLARADKRALLRAYRIRILVTRPVRKSLRVERVEIESLDELCLYN